LRRGRTPRIDALGYACLSLINPVPLSNGGLRWAGDPLYHVSGNALSRTGNPATSRYVRLVVGYKLLLAHAWL